MVVYTVSLADTRLSASSRGKAASATNCDWPVAARELRGKARPDTALSHMPQILDVEALAAELNALAFEHRVEELEQGARAALFHFPHSRWLRVHLAFALLHQGRYREGFREWEARPAKAKAPVKDLPYPEWDGPLAGRSILVWGEQGIGDEIQGVRFVRLLRDLGAARVTLACRDPAVRAFQEVGADEVIARLGHITVPKHDCWVCLWSLPYKLGLTLDDISGDPYLSVPRTGGGGIGLVERGGAHPPHRSMPDGMLTSAIPEGRLLVPKGDVYDSLRQVAGLDLLITIDTSWAHMAGALGVPCWVLLPHRWVDWRWMLHRSDSPWYRSVTLFRQPTHEDWTSVVRTVRAALDEMGLGPAGA